MSNERLPQRFRYQVIRGGYWQYGMMLPTLIDDTAKPYWYVVFSNGVCGSFALDPWETLGYIIYDVDEFQWIDNDYGWAGDVMPREQIGSTVATHLRTCVKCGKVEDCIGWLPMCDECAFGQTRQHQSKPGKQEPQ